MIPLPILYLVFLLSGGAALIYQVVWQRALFSIYGVNIESVTIVVTAFMVGLGLGSFAGGRLSADPKRPLLMYFGIIELGIGLYGALSLTIFSAVGSMTAGAGPTATFALSFALVLLPTALMGSTLPLLVAHLVRGSGNVGQSVGVLYFVNTLGSAVASFVAGVVLLKHFGKAGTVYTAAAINVLVAFAILIPVMRSRSTPSPV